MSFNLFVQNVLSSGLILSDPEKVRKFIILNIFLLVFMIVAPLLGLFYWAIGARYLFYATLCAALLMVPAFFLLRKTKSIQWVGNFVILVLWGSLLYISWNTGAVTHEGVLRPSWILNGGLILFAIFLNGYLWGTVWISLVFAETGVVVFLFRRGYSFPDVIPNELSAVYALGAYMLSLLALISLAFLFEKVRSDASLREQEKAAAIRESKKYIDDILERSPVPTFIMDRNHRIIQWNRACQDLTGVSVGDILGKGVWEGFDIDGRGSIADLVLDNPNAIEETYGDSIVSKGADGWFELEMFLPKLGGGQSGLIAVSPIADNGGNIRGAIQTFQTLRVQGRVPDILKDGVPGAMNEFYHSPVFRIDRQGEIVYWNRACAEALGYDAPEMIGKSPFVFLSKRYRPIFKETLIRAFRGEDGDHKSWKYYSKEHRPVYVQARVYAVGDPSGRAKECLVVNTDITDLRLRMKKLELYAANTKEKLKKLTGEHNMLKRNIATFIRKKED